VPGKRAILNKLIERSCSRSSATSSIRHEAFGLDGGEAMIPAWSRSSSAAVNWASPRSCSHGAPRTAQRARNVLGKPLRAIFNEFKAVVQAGRCGGLG